MSKENNVEVSLPMVKASFQFLLGDDFSNCINEHKLSKSDFGDYLTEYNLEIVEESRQGHSSQFKDYVISLVKLNGLRVSTIARMAGITPSSISTWSKDDSGTSREQEVELKGLHPGILIFAPSL